MDALEILEQLENTSGSNAKKTILEEHQHHSRLKELLDAALNFKRKFHIKKFNEDKPFFGIQGADKHARLMELLDKLESRTYTGKKAADYVDGFFHLCTKQEQKWYARVLRKDLKIGVNISTVNKCGFDIPVFDVQLAKDGRKCSKLDSILTKGAYASPKLDGYRCIAICNKGDITLYSRNGTVYENFPDIEAAIAEAWGEFDIVLDGEIMSNDFNSMQQSAFASKRGTTVGDVTYHVFDAITMGEWNTDNFKLKAGNRYQFLTGMFIDAASRGVLDVSKLCEVPHTTVKSMQDILQLEKQYIISGYEGVMVNPDIPYYRGKKSNKMLKFKTMLSMEATVDGCYEGRPGTKYVGTLGGLHVTQENGITCDIGSGFSDEERNWIWENKKLIEGRVMEVAFQELTPDQRMRFPIFKRWRPDKEA